VGFLDRVCAHAATVMQSTASALQTSTGALEVVHRGIFPSQVPPKTPDALAAPFAGEATTMADFTRVQTVRGSELTFQLLLGHQVAGDFEKVVSGFPKKPDGKIASLSGFKARAGELASKLVATIEKRAARVAEAAAAKRSQSRSGSVV
jgi:hypothetical protein